MYSAGLQYFATVKSYLNIWEFISGTNYRTPRYIFPVFFKAF